MSSSQVAVYLLASDVNSTRTTKLSSLFSNPLFSLNVIAISPPSNMTPEKNMSVKDLIESYRIQWCLKDAKNRYPKNHVIVAKDSSISDASPNRIADVVSAATNNGQWDVCYLSKWMDRCDLYSNKKPINGTMTTLTKTVSPHGLQAIILSPKGREVILGNQPMKNGEMFDLLEAPLSQNLNEKIVSGNLEATATVPNLLTYDITFANKSSDYLKTHECLVSDDESTESTETNNSGEKNLQQTSGSSWFWFLLIIIILILLGGYFYMKRK